MVVKQPLRQLEMSPQNLQQSTLIGIHSAVNYTPLAPACSHRVIRTSRKPDKRICLSDSNRHLRSMKSTACGPLRLHRLDMHNGGNVYRRALHKRSTRSNGDEDRPSSDRRDTRSSCSAVPQTCATHHSVLKWSWAERDHRALKNST